MSFGQIEANVSQAVATIVLKRNTAYHLANTVLQIMILLLISFMSFYFDLDNFSDRIMMTLTTMLVITTMLASIQEVSVTNFNLDNKDAMSHLHNPLFQDLPKTSYYKLMDWWLLISVNSLVYSMAVHTYLAKVMKEEEEKHERKEEEAAEKEEQGKSAWEKSQPGSAKSKKEPEDENPQHADNSGGKKKKMKMSKPELVNFIGKWGFILINFLSNLVIGIVALVEYNRDIEEFL